MINRDRPTCLLSSNHPPWDRRLCLVGFCSVCVVLLVLSKWMLVLASYCCLLEVLCWHGDCPQSHGRKNASGCLLSKPVDTACWFVLNCPAVCRSFYFKPLFLKHKPPLYCLSKTAHALLALVKTDSPNKIIPFIWAVKCSYNSYHQDLMPGVHFMALLTGHD